MFSGRFTIALVVTAALVHSSALAQEPLQTGTSAGTGANQCERHAPGTRRLDKRQR